MCYNTTTITRREDFYVNMKDKRQFKMTPEQLQGLLHMRKRGYVQKNGKAYKRKDKHKNKNVDNI